MILVNYWKLVVLERYALFEGRAGRAEFWYFALALFIVNVAINILMRVSGIFFVLALIWGLAMLIPGIAVAIRRLHDTDKSGWLLLIGLIPIIGWIILIVFYATPGNPAQNQYGPPPADLPPA